MKSLFQRVIALVWAILDNADQLPADIVAAARDLEDDVVDAINDQEGETDE